MQKKIHRYFLIILLCFCLSFLSQPMVFAKKDIPTLQEQMDLIQNDIRVDDLDIEPINTQDLKNNIVPDSRREGQKVLFLFLKTMFAVALASCIIYIVMLFIGKYRSSAFVETEYDEYAVLNLATPSNKQEAFMSFMSRTNF